METQAVSPIDVASQRYNSASPRNQTSNLTSALQEAAATGQQPNAINIGNRFGDSGRLSVGGRQDSISGEEPSSYYGSGARPISMNKEKLRRDSNNGSYLGGRSWGAMSIGSWIGNEIYMKESYPNFFRTPSFQSSSYLPKMEAQMLQGYKCCDLQIDSLHDLLQHYEEAHAQAPSQPMTGMRRPPSISSSGRPSVSAHNAGGVQLPGSNIQLNPSGNQQAGITSGQNTQLNPLQTFSSNNFNQAPLSPIQDDNEMDDFNMELDDAPMVPQLGGRQQNQNNNQVPQLNIAVANAMQARQGLKSATPTTPSTAHQGFPLQHNPTVSSVNTPTLGTHSGQLQQNKSSPESSVPGTPGDMDFDMAGNYGGGMPFNMQGNNADWNGMMFGNGGGADMSNMTINNPEKSLFSKQGASNQQLQFALAQAQAGQNPNLMAGVNGFVPPFQEEHKPFRCPVIGCEKAYKNQNGLKYHKSHGHQNQQLRENADGTFSIVDPTTSIPYPGTVGMEKEKPYRCDFCGKRYKNLNGLKYHRQHAPACNPENRQVQLNAQMAMNVNVAGAGLPATMGDQMMM